MSMLDSFFNKGFKAAKCKTLLKLTIPRIKLLRNRREIQMKQMRRDIAKLLETGQEATARIRVEHIIREEKMMAAQEIIELFCELISVRLPIIEAQRECPLDLKEAISSICFAAPRCADLPELQQVQMLFATKYGREFVAAASELMPDCGVNRQLIELLSIRAPPADAKLKLLKEIAEEHELEWDPAASEAELFKSHEDLLNGSTQFVSGSKLPLPKEKHDESLYSTANQTNNEEDEEEDAGFVLDFPEVPTVSIVCPVPNNDASAPEISPPAPPAPILPDNHPESSNLPEIRETHLQERQSGPEEAVERVVDNKQFLPFISPPSLSSVSFSIREEPKETCPAPSLLRTNSEPSVDLQDVIAAAQAAAETAERAAAAARSVASLAQLRISELTRKNDKAPLGKETSCDNPFSTQNATPESASDSPDGHLAHSDTSKDEDLTPVEPVKFDVDSSPPSQQPQFDGDSSPPSQQPQFDADSSPSSKQPEFDADSSPPSHQPQRLPSMEDDPYFTYPSLFSSQNPTNGANSHLFTESRFDKEP